MEEKKRNSVERLLLFARDFVIAWDYFDDRFDQLLIKVNDGREFEIEKINEILQEPDISYFSEVQVYEKALYASEEGNTLKDRMIDCTYEEEDIKHIVGAMTAEVLWDYTYEYELHGSRAVLSGEEEIAERLCEWLEDTSKEYGFEISYGSYFFIFREREEE